MLAGYTAQFLEFGFYRINCGIMFPLVPRKWKMIDFEKRALFPLSLPSSDFSTVSSINYFKAPYAAFVFHIFPQLAFLTYCLKFKHFCDF